MKKILFSAAMISVSFLITGCYPEGPEYVEDYDIVITHHNDKYDFGSKTTYSIPDRIVKITGTQEPGDDPVFIPDNVADQILARITSNMDALGFEKVDLSADANPDLVLVPAALESVFTYYFYDYWQWYWGGYYPGWGWSNFYPGWWTPPVYVESLSTGTLLMLLVDPHEVSASGNPVAQWSGLLNGILSSTFNSTRVNNLIDKAFNQSPYLKTN